MHKTVIKSVGKSLAVRQLSRYLSSEKKEFDNPVDEMNNAISGDGYIGKVWVKVKEYIEEVSESAKAMGLAEGKQLGVEEYKIDLADQVESFKKTVDSFSENTEQALNELERSIVSLSVKIAEKIIRKKITEDENITLDMVNSSILKAKKGLKITVRVNPAEYDFIANYSEQPSVKNENVLILSDENVESGGCVIESELGLIDAQIETQLEVIEKKLVDEKDLMKEEPDESLS